MKLSALLAALPDVCPAPSSDPDITEICTDPRTVTPSSLFIALRGLHHDAHRDLCTLSPRPSAAVILSDYQGPLPEELPIFRTESTRRASALLHSRFYGDPGRELMLVAVTGTNGKTSTTHMLRAILRAAAIPCEVIGTLSGTLTTPDPPELYRLMRQYADQGCQAILLEASSHALALEKLDALKPDYGIFTNLTPEHLDFHHTIEEYRRAKERLFSLCRIGILNQDDPSAPLISQSATCPILTYGIADERSDYHARNLNLKKNGAVRYDCRSGDLIFRVDCPIPGRFTVYNTLAAIACAHHMGIPLPCIRAALAGMPPIPGRLERLSLGRCPFSVYLDYAHTPDALENVLLTLRASMLPHSRLTLLFGCGGDRDKSKRPIMGAIAARLCDRIIVTSDNSRSEDPAAIIDDILVGIGKAVPHVVIQSRAAAIDYAVRTAAGGETLLLCGKGHENYEIDASGRHPFSERDLVRVACEKYYGL